MFIHFLFLLFLGIASGCLSNGLQPAMGNFKFQNINVYVVLSYQFAQKHQ